VHYAGYHTLWRKIFVKIQIIVKVTELQNRQYPSWGTRMALPGITPGEGLLCRVSYALKVCFAGYHTRQRQPSPGRPTSPGIIPGKWTIFFKKLNKLKKSNLVFWLHFKIGQRFFENSKTGRCSVKYIYLEKIRSLCLETKNGIRFFISNFCRLYAIFMTPFPHIPWVWNTAKAYFDTYHTRRRPLSPGMIPGKKLSISANSN